uniref:LexA family protein n=1 Tax=Nocardia sp. TaxID=1821 RepID=UPI002589988E
GIGLGVLGALLVALSATGGVLPTLIGTVRDWLERQAGRHRISVTIDGAMIDDEATVKVYRRRNGHVYLEPRNPAYEVIDGDRAAVLGKVVSVMRRV